MSFNIQTENMLYVPIHQHPLDLIFYFVEAVFI